MGLNKSDREEIAKIAVSKGYSWSSNEDKLKNDSKQASFSSSGQSVVVNGTRYNSVADARKSTKW